MWDALKQSLVGNRVKVTNPETLPRQKTSEPRSSTRTTIVVRVRVTTFKASLNLDSPNDFTPRTTMSFDLYKSHLFKTFPEEEKTLDFPSSISKSEKIPFNCKEKKFLPTSFG
jgi:hypothetical protein